VLDIDQHGPDPPFDQPLRASRVGFVTVFLDPGQEQVILDRQTTQKRSFGGVIPVRFERGQNLAHLQAAARAADDARSPRILLAIYGGKAADAAEQAEPDVVLA
jgi:hypothetical protein